MFRIAICDDEASICSHLEEILDKLGKQFLNDFEIEIYYSGEDLCKYLYRGSYYDIIFLDIELQTMNGVEIGQIIRDQMHNDTTQIIYISGKESYAMDLFKVRPLDFIIKPFDLERIKKTLSITFRIIQNNKIQFHYKIGHTSHFISLKDILYFESVNRRIILHSTNDIHMFYDKLNKVYEKLKIFRFINIHKSYLVNYNHVIELEYHQVTMSNKVVLPISQANRKRIRSLQLELEGDKKWV